MWRRLKVTAATDGHFLGLKDDRALAERGLTALFPFMLRIWVEKKRTMLAFRPPISAVRFVTGI